MILTGDGPIAIGYDNVEAGQVTLAAGDTVLLPAALTGGRLLSAQPCSFLEITLGEE